MSKSKRQECFVNGHCCYDCPNFDIQTADERYGYGIAEDMGLEEIECKDCFYNMLMVISKWCSSTAVTAKVFSPTLYPVSSAFIQIGQPVQLNVVSSGLLILQVKGFYHKSVYILFPLLRGFDDLIKRELTAIFFYAQHPASLRIIA